MGSHYSLTVPWSELLQLNLTVRRSSAPHPVTPRHINRDLHLLSVGCEPDPGLTKGFYSHELLQS